MDITTGSHSSLPRISLRLAVDGQVSPVPLPKMWSTITRIHIYGMERIEVRSRSGNAHPGHVFTDGPKRPRWPTLLYQFGLSALYSKRGNGRRRLWIFVKSIEIIEKAS